MRSRTRSWSRATSTGGGCKKTPPRHAHKKKMRCGMRETTCSMRHVESAGGCRATRAQNPAATTTSVRMRGTCESVPLSPGCSWSVRCGAV